MGELVWLILTNIILLDRPRTHACNAFTVLRPDNSSVFNIIIISSP